VAAAGVRTRARPPPRGNLYPLVGAEEAI